MAEEMTYEEAMTLAAWHETEASKQESSAREHRDRSKTLRNRYEYRTLGLTEAGSGHTK